MNIKYKILTGFGDGREVSINEDELKKAYYLFMNGGRWIFSGGPVDGKNIQGVVEDWNSTMGWNKTHKLDDYDYAELNEKGLTRHARNALEEAKVSVLHGGSERKTLSEEGETFPEIGEEIKRIAKNKNEPTYDR